MISPVKLAIISFIALPILLHKHKEDVFIYFYNKGWTTVCITALYYCTFDLNICELAAKKGDVKLLKYLSTLDEGSTVESLYSSIMLEEEGDLAPLKAAENNHLEILKYLHANAYDMTLGYWNEQPLAQIAAEHGNLKILQWLIEEELATPNMRLAANRTVLMYAAREGHLHVVKWLLDQDGIDINASDMSRKTALMFAVQRSHVELVHYLARQEGVDLDCVDDQGNCAFDFAFNNECIQITRDLLTCGARLPPPRLLRY